MSNPTILQSEDSDAALKARPKHDMTWAQYAEKYKQCFVTKARDGSTSWLMFIPSSDGGGSVYRDTIEEIREKAAEYGCTIIL